MQDFRKLQVWQKAHMLYKQVFSTTGQMPGRAPQSLLSQLTRAADSVVSNIAEGAGSSSSREFARFLGMTIRSCSELESHLLNARGIGAITASEHDTLANATVEIRKMTIALQRRVRARENE